MNEAADITRRFPILTQGIQRDLRCKISGGDVRVGAHRRDLQRYLNNIESQECSSIALSRAVHSTRLELTESI